MGYNPPTKPFNATLSKNEAAIWHVLSYEWKNTKEVYRDSLLGSGAAYGNAISRLDTRGLIESRNATIHKEWRIKPRADSGSTTTA